MGTKSNRKKDKPRVAKKKQRGKKSSRKAKESDNMHVLKSYQKVYQETRYVSRNVRMRG